MSRFKILLKYRKLCILLLFTAQFVYADSLAFNDSKKSRGRYNNFSSFQGKDQRPQLPSTSRSRVSAEDAHIRIADAGTKGLGAFCTKNILRGELIGEYNGELLTLHQVQARYWGTRAKKAADRRWIKNRRKRHQGLSGDYLFDLGMDTFLDGEDADISGWCRFMNHAREDSSACNVETSYGVRKCAAKSPDGAEDNNDEGRINGSIYSSDLEAGAPRVWFVAMRDIEAGEELSYDYGDSYWDY